MSVTFCAAIRASMVANLKKMSAIGAESRSIVLTGAKKCLVLVVGGLGGLGGQKKETFSEPGIEPGDSRWQRLMLPLHHSE